VRFLDLRRMLDYVRSVATRIGSRACPKASTLIPSSYTLQPSISTPRRLIRNIARVYSSTPLYREITCLGDQICFFPCLTCHDICTCNYGFRDPGKAGLEHNMQGISYPLTICRTVEGTASVRKTLQVSRWRDGIDDST